MTFARVALTASLLALAGCGAETAVATPASSPAATARPTAQPTARPTAPPTAEPTLDAQIVATAAYFELTQRRIPLMIAALTAEGTACSGGDFVTCRAAAHTVASTAQAFLDEMAGTPPPTNLQRSAGLLRQGLGDFIAGSNLQVKGIDDLDPTEIGAGSTIIAQATTEIQAATAAISAP